MTYTSPSTASRVAWAGRFITSCRETYSVHLGTKDVKSNFEFNIVGTKKTLFPIDRYNSSSVISRSIQPPIASFGPVKRTALDLSYYKVWEVLIASLLYLWLGLVFEISCSQSEELAFK